MKSLKKLENKSIKNIKTLKGGEGNTPPPSGGTWIAIKVKTPTLLEE